MTFTTDFELGDISSILINKRYTPEMKVFASLSSGDGAGVLDFAAEYLKNSSVSEASKIKIRLIISIIFLSKNDRKNCVTIINSLGEPDLTKLGGWIPAFFYSLWRLIVLQLSVKHHDLAPSLIFPPERKVAIIGDSHLIGMMSALGRLAYFSYYYIPGVRYSYLASPQMNLKKIGVSNAILHSYECDEVIFSVGEIDTRDVYCSLQNGNIDGYKYSPEYFQAITLKSIFFIKSLLGIHQKLTIIVPPPPSEVLLANYNKEEVQAIIKRMVSINAAIKDSITKTEVNLLQYPYANDDGNFLSFKSILIDHAHFKPNIYAELLGFSVLKSH
jgi:hypothetical protein